MGWGPGDLAQASLWQYQAAFDGWLAANTSEDDDGLTGAEEDALWAQVQAHERRLLN